MHADITSDVIAAAESLVDLSFSETERELMRAGLGALREKYRLMRGVRLPNDIAPALPFDPRAFVPPRQLPSWPDHAPAPDTLDARHTTDDIAFATVAELGALLRARRLSSVELTNIYLERLQHHHASLNCVVTLTAELAGSQARRADDELAAGIDRGPLHGIPWGAKDLLATAGIPTTWGALPYRDQIPDADAAVVERLAGAGAVLVAKLSLGELAWGDVWFGGQTRNPWNLDRGSSGSSAGSGAAVAAGLVGFAIGTETWGSIVSPGSVCGVSGLRPSFGRVSRYGAMTLAWSMDKIGPMCRSAQDCALVFAAIAGADPRDPATRAAPFRPPAPADLRGVRIGYLESAFAAAPDDDDPESRENDAIALDVLRDLGAELIPIELPELPVEALSIILDVEAASAFDELTRSNRDDLLVRQIEDAWPNVLRRARLVPAVEYVQANRMRTLLIQELDRRLAGVALYVAPSFGTNLLLTNLTGHPAVVVPNGFTPGGLPTSISFTGHLDDEATILAVAAAYQQATAHHRARPPLFYQGGAGTL